MNFIPADFYRFCYPFFVLSMYVYQIILCDWLFFMVCEEYVCAREM